jgi:dipeptidyl aminopeptidase/acylaminoacyl peptidase
MIRRLAAARVWPWASGLMPIAAAVLDAQRGATLYLPPDHRAGSRVPLVVGIHPGPFGAWSESFGAYPLDLMPIAETEPFKPYLYASLGYGVLLPNVRGGTTYSTAWARGLLKDIGGAEYWDVMTGVE